MQEVLVDLLAAPTVVHSFAGVAMPRLGDGYPFGIYRCADGYLGVNILTQGHWVALCELIDRDDLVDHPRYRTGAERADPAVAAELDAIITAWAATQQAGPTFRAGQEIRCPITIVPGPTEVLASEQYAARDFWVDVDDPELGPLRLPGFPFVLASGAFAGFRSHAEVA